MSRVSTKQIQAFTPLSSSLPASPKIPFHLAFAFYFSLINLSEPSLKTKLQNFRAFSRAAMATSHLSKLAPCLLLCFVSLQLLADSGVALHVGIQNTDASVSVTKECSRKCESEFCSVPPFLRYGKYCGLLYSGCPGENPCDGLDACCKSHDDCVQARNNDYLSQQCNQHLLDCIANFKHAGEHPFKGNKCKVEEVMEVISVVIEAALITGRLLHRP